MTSRYDVYSDDSISSEDKIRRLKEINDELSESLHRLGKFQKQVLTIKQAKSVDDALDQMEMLLDDVVEFIYARLYLKDESGAFCKYRELAPEDLELDWSLVEWACDSQEIAVIPTDSQGGGGDTIHSLLLLPFSGHVGTVGIIILWLDTDPTKFTQEQSTLLTMISRETAAVIETHRFRERIEEARKAIEDVMESVPHGIMQVDNRGVVNLINHNLEFMLDIRRGDAIGSNFDQVFHKDISKVLDGLVFGSVSEEQEISITLRGVEEVYGLTATPMYSTGGDRPDSFVVICRDLKLSREVVKLRELDSMKNDFLSLVSHELRTPLTSIMAYSETLLMEGMIDTEEERKEYLQIIYDEGARLSRLINDVLDLTKMEAGKMDYIYGDYNVNDVIHNALGSSSSLANQKEIQLLTELEENLPDAKVDSDRIMQVLMNFLSNAIKFTENGGTVTVRSRSTSPEEGKSIPTITVSVEDTGCGISPENLNRVFSKFEQIENINHHSIGTGLGMPICQQIIEDGHSGKVWVESELGVGTQVYFRIPVA